MKRLFLLYFILCIGGGSNAQNLTQQWATSFAGSGENSDKFNALIRDVSGNIYAAGYTWRAGNGKDFLLVKFNSAGDTLWTRTYDGTGNGNDEINSLVFDNTGNIALTGYTKTSNGKDITTAEYNTTGDMLWTKDYNYTGSLDDYGIKVVADNAGNVYAAGYGYNANLNNDYILVKYSSAGTQLGVVSFDGADGQDDVLADAAIDGNNNIIVTGRTKSSATKYDYGTVKYNSSLAPQWFKAVDQAGKSDRATGVWVDASNDVYVTGRSSNGNDDDFLTIKYLSANGAAGWALPKLFNSNGDDQALAIAGNANEVVVTGTKFNGLQTDIQTVAYAPADGAQLWSTAYANPNGKDETPNHVSIGPADAVVVTGSTNVSTTATSDNDLLILKYSGTGAQQFAKTIGGDANLDDNGAASLFDGSGNIYTVGGLVNNSSMKDAALLEHNSAGTLQFNKAYNGEGEFTEKGVAMCMSGGFLYSTGYTYAYGEDRNFCTIKYDAAGNKVWVKTLNGPDSDTDEPKAIAGDGSGNIYVAGRSKNTNNDYDMFVIKYNPNGDTLWTRNYDGGVLGDDEVNGMAVDASGNVYITGLSDEDGSLLVNNDFMTVKFSSSGAFQWATPYNGSGNADDRAYAIVLDNAGNAFVTGRTWNGTDYDIQTNKYSSANGTETLFASYLSNLGDDQPAKIVLDNSGNVVIGATSDRNPSTTSTDRDYLTIQYNSSGVQQWAQLYNGIGTGDDDLYGLVVDGSGNVYVTGSSDLDSSSVDNLDYVTIKYNSAGTKQWSQNYNGAANQDDVANAITIDGTGNIYVAGESNEGSLSVKNNNCTTIVYSPGGTDIQHVSFNGPLNGTDAGSAILYDNGSIYETGYGSYTAADQKDFLTIKYNLTTGINEVNENNAMQVYPNPTTTNFTIAYEGLQGTAKVSIVDVEGRTAVSEFTADSGLNIISLDIHQLSAGVYFVRLRDEGHSLTRKIVVQ